MHSKILWMLAVVLLVPSQSGLAFERRIGARTLGMGDAFCSLADDLYTLNYNPAGLALEKNIECSLEYASLYLGLKDGGIQENHFTYAQTLAPETGFGVGWNNRSLPRVYFENEFMAGIGFKPLARTPFYAGLTGKVFYLGYTDPFSLAWNPYFKDNHEKVQVGLDVGFLYQAWHETATTPGIRLGLAAYNLNQPDLGLRTVARLPLEYRMGASAEFGEWDGALDLLWKESQLQYHAGVEKWFADRQLAVRSGLIAGDGTSLTWALGGTFSFDLNAMRVRLNYAFNYPVAGIVETFGSHRVSLDFVYGSWVGKQPPAGENSGRDVRSRAANLMQDLKQTVIVRQAREFLRERIADYLDLTRKVDASIDRGDAGAGWESMRQTLTQARHCLIGQDVEGFLQALKAADQQYKSLETTLPGTGGRP